MVERLQNRLIRLIGDLEEGEMPPTAAATDKCEELLAAAADTMSTDSGFPFPHISSLGEGDLSCEWRADDRLVLLFVTAEGETALSRMSLAGKEAATGHKIASPSVEEIVAAVSGLEDSTPVAR